MKKISKLIDPLIVKLIRDDQLLMKEVKKGNNEAFRKIFDKYKKPIMNYLNNMVKNQAIAESITQDVFLKVYKNRESYDESRKFSTWLWTIAKRTGFDYLKKKKEILVNDMKDKRSDDFERDASQTIVDEQEHIDLQLIARSEKEVIARCIDELKDSQKNALRLRVFSELSYKEIADVMETTDLSVKSLITRAKSGVKKCVKNCLGENYEK